MVAMEEIEQEEEEEESVSALLPHVDGVFRRCRYPGRCGVQMCARYRVCSCAMMVGAGASDHVGPKDRKLCGELSRVAGARIM